MSHNFDHDHCSDEAHVHDHDHAHDSLGLGPQNNLFPQVDIQNVRVLNAAGDAASGDGSVVIKPWDRRLDESEFLESDVDAQLILRVPFVSSVRLKAILFKTGPTDFTPSKVAIYATDDSLDFEDVVNRQATQEFDIVQGRDVGEYIVKTAKFSNLSCISLFFPASQGADTIRIYYVGFLGQWNKLHKNPVITVYEAQANPADHEKVQGTDGSFSSPQT